MGFNDSLGGLSGITQGNIMTLLEIRTSLAKKSGRYDLVNPSTFADNGMDFHINAGQIYLDGVSEAPRADTHIFETIAVSEYYLTFDRKCRNISSVFGNNALTRFELEEIEFADLKTTYDAAMLTAATGEPASYARASLRILATAAATTIDNFMNLDWPDEDDTKYEFQGLIIIPPADGTYTLSVRGDFLPAILASNTDTNYWATNYPHILEMAALRSIEVFNRNTAGVRDWTEAIHAETVLLDLDPGYNYDTDS